MIQSDILILPGTELFDACFASLPPPPDKETVKHKTAGEYNYIVRSGSSYNLMQCVSSTEATEYVFGGEYEVRMSDFPSDEDYDPSDYIPYEQWKALVRGDEVEADDGFDS